MKSILFPRITKAELVFIIKHAFVGAILAGAFGIIHDQITFSLSSEYFTHMKFKQFQYADLGLGDRVFVATIGFLATWWVGFFIGWFLSRAALANQHEIFLSQNIVSKNNASKNITSKNIRSSFVIVFFTALLISVSVGLYSYFVADFYDYPSWKYTLEHYRIQHINAFMQVVFIHYASYLGGLVGFFVALLWLKSKRHSSL